MAHGSPIFTGSGEAVTIICQPGAMMFMDMPPPDMDATAVAISNASGCVVYVGFGFAQGLGPKLASAIRINPGETLVLAGSAATEASMATDISCWCAMSALVTVRRGT
ncbi:hypothetical protein, partial [Acidiphilium sp.]|uniref:hypothetical protein n=1 Tax=Acidiphilium sp. TaxID=527 RepID=UPI00258A43EA